MNQPLSDKEAEQVWLSLSDDVSLVPVMALQTLLLVHVPMHQWSTGLSQLAFNPVRLQTRTAPIIWLEVCGGLNKNGLP